MSIELRVSPMFYQHPALFTFSQKLGRIPPEAAGFIIRLHLMAAAFPGSPPPESLQPRELAMAGDWRGNHRKFSDALRESGWLNPAQYAVYLKPFRRPQRKPKPKPKSGNAV